MPLSEVLTLDNKNTIYQFFLTFLSPNCHNQHILNDNFEPLKDPITTFTIIFGPFWVPIAITYKIFMLMLDLPKMKILFGCQL